MKVKLIHTPADPVRLSFPDIFQATDYQGDKKFRYNATLLVSPGGENHNRIEAAIKTVAADEYGKKAEQFLAQWRGNAQKFCYLNGDTKEYEGYEGMMFLACHRKQKDGPPTVLDRDKSPLVEASGRPYAGCFVNASTEIYAQGGLNAGIRASFSGIQFVADGDSFGGGAPASPDEFEDLGVPETDAALV